MAKESEDIEETTVEEPTKNGGRSCKPVTNAIWAEGSKAEVQAFYFNNFGRAVLFISVTFLSFAILELANKQAGCPKNDDGVYEDCGKRVYGAKPSSMLSLMAVLGGVITAMFMPYAGAIVDYTPYRRAFGIGCATVLVLANTVQIFLFESTWFVLAIIQAVFAAASFIANAMVMWSYVKDSAESDHALHGITTSGRLWETFGMFGFLILVTVVGVASGWDSVSLARFSQALAVALGGTFLWLAYSRYAPRPAQQEVPEGKGLYTAGMSSLYNTFTQLGKTAPGAKRFFMAVVFIDAATGSFTTLGVTYLKEQLELTDFQSQVFLILTLLCGIPGSIFHRTVGRRFGHKRGFLACLMYWIGTTVLFVLVLSGPGQKNLAYLFGVLFGIAYGWYFPAINGFFISLLPPGRDVEMWGWNQFASVILSWVPPLIFTGLNETVDDLRLGMVGLISFHVIGLIIAFTIDDSQTWDEEKVLSESDELSDEEVGESAPMEESALSKEEELVINEEVGKSTPMQESALTKEDELVMNEEVK
uniref:Major facilitator superfamily (MFS) profile domain-containing protein n=1 Tax=Helicotheca tamesis TaxID=374047 RepID=A0A7S2GRC7_9STRA|mmetsp:Transcript_10461/g.14651  ORF Transcript_10461/g.14651 Transcript_10461/m.14651 type:complete len:533 (+) Transcript_10461:162-1760(+)|eukprot:CAMPEP_0185727808 /NCGR_PEP_ID=MMETSP1171-20130828/3392_1 /TAXON_ID=374046 /ORGANISM="Helicotheca tamensis, Strain CCMP826" /LENGTH=532 /DNA_ID=CAMNT_0028396443 /DNA_START=126 /DNA_END=1724 /DNA_ORIENTATION=+